MKRHRPVSMIILDAILILWWIIFVIMFFTVLIKTNRPTGIYGFYAKGLVVIFNLLISEGEGKLRNELDVGRLVTSILLLFPAAWAIGATNLYFDFFDYVDQYRRPCVRLNILTYLICLYINISPSINEYLKNYKWQHWLEPWRNCYSYYKDDLGDQT